MDEALPGLPERVRDVISRSGRTQRAFAAVIGIDPTKLSKALKGVRRFTAAELIRIADHAGVTVNWLLNGHDDALTVAAAPRNASATPSLPPADTDSAHAQSVRRRIIEAAWQLIAEHGYYAVRIADIADRSGLPADIISAQFPSLRGLLDETLRSSVKQAFDRQVAVLHEIPDAGDRLLRLIELQLPGSERLRLEWSIWVQVWTESTLDPRIRALHADSYQRWHDTIVQTLRAGVDNGAFRPLDPDETAIHLSALIDGLGIQVLTGRPGRTVERMRATLHAFVADRLAPVRPAGAETDPPPDPPTVHGKDTRP
ncbi:TetR family transcriptional regulator [Murinocardiopsis flavida]|uniref:TetR family transcriptional regulator n=1 Tax=Murinocardiopsis flavida TaxID=645275 RepID=A0A2P8D2F0_9ACTN|nr:TetR/AcrR family transcriptional regulator [Murinocardiopsis flavida]PSK91381.1 TetR family transcriptional regulator [Murinocardiopsis flavida]